MSVDQMSPDKTQITFANVSRFYGEVLGINKVSLSIPPGITSLVGPNGSGKTTLMNLMTGLIRPSQGEITVLGIRPDDPERLCRAVGYCAQFDSFPKGITGYQFRAPGEWFSELYAAWKRGKLKPSHPAVAWLSKLKV